MQTIMKHGFTTQHTKDNIKECNEVFPRSSALKEMIHHFDKNSNITPSINDHIKFLKRNWNLNWGCSKTLADCTSSIVTIIMLKKLRYKS